MSKYLKYSREELMALVEKQDGELASKKYGLVWDAEREPEQVVLDCEHNLPVLKRVKGKEIREPKGGGLEDNILIEGDNYHALTVLNYTHHEKIDVIYIDPPYNTGNQDFKYNDRFVEKEDGFRHSKWLNFMEKRLNLAKELLKETGVIFISIDDNEQAQLKMLCDKVFGQENSLGTLTWINKSKPVNSGKAKFQIQQNVEYIFVYSKQTKEEHEGFDLVTQGERKYSYSDEEGEYRLVDIEDSDKGRKKRDTMKFEILGIRPGAGKRWKIGKEEIDSLIKLKRIISIEEKIKRKIYKHEESGIIESPFWSHLLNVNTAEGGKKELSGVIGDEHGFDTVKSASLIIDLLLHFKSDALILDFFAGSGTTGHAVLELNKEDGGNRKFILCTNNENKICEEVTYPRLQKVIKGYKKNGDGEKVEGLGGNLQYFKTDLVKDTKNNVQVRIDVTRRCTEMLCVKENIFNLDIEEEDYKIFSSNKADTFLCVYYNYPGRGLKDFLREIKKLSGKKIVYLFSMNEEADKGLLAGVEDCIVEAIPQKILDVYNRLVKMNIPVKSDTIFLEFEKANKKIFDDKEKDEGARILRIVLEKTIQKIAQKNSISIFKDNHKEEKIATINDQLKEAKVFNKVQWEENKTYLAIGNNASHGDYGDYDIGQVENFYRHTQSLLNDFGI